MTPSRDSQNTRTPNRHINLFDHEPPHSAHAERSVLGAILINPAAIQTALDILPNLGQDAFHIPAHQAIFTAAAELHQSGQPVDLVTVHQHLENTNQLELAGGAPHLAELTGAAPTSANIAHYARIVRDLHRDRRQISAAARLIHATQARDTPEIAEAQQDLATIQTEGLDPLQAVQWPDDWVEQARKPLPWLIPSWLLKGTVTVLYAHGSTGKTFLAMDLAVSAATGTTLLPGLAPLRRTPTLFLDLENTEESAKRRIAFILDGWQLDRHHLTDSLRTHFTLIQRRGAFIEPAPSGRFTESDFFRQLLSQVRQTKPGLIIIDHLRRIGGQAESNRTEHMGMVIEKCDLLARESGAAVLVLAHASKEAHRRAAGIENAKGSTTITDEARAAWEFRPDDQNPEILCLSLEKANEAKKDIKLYFRLQINDTGAVLVQADAPPIADPARHKDGYSDPALQNAILNTLPHHKVSKREVRERIGPGQIFLEAVSKAIGYPIPPRVLYNTVCRMEYEGTLDYENSGYNNKQKTLKIVGNQAGTSGKSPVPACFSYEQEGFFPELNKNPENQEKKREFQAGTSGNKRETSGIPAWKSSGNGEPPLKGGGIPRPADLISSEVPAWNEAQEGETKEENKTTLTPTDDGPLFSTPYSELSDEFDDEVF